MDKRDFMGILDYEVNRGNICALTNQEKNNLYRKFLEDRDNSDYYLSLHPESDAAISFENDIIDKIISPYKN